MTKNYKPSSTPRGTHPNSVANRNTFSTNNQPADKSKKPPKHVERSDTRLRRILGILQTAKNPFTGETEDFTTAELLDLAQVMKALKGDTKAYTELLDRLEGKSTQHIEQTNTIRSIIIDTTGVENTASDLLNDITPHEEINARRITNGGEDIEIHSETSGSEES